MHKIFYIGWVGFNNVGDELMLECFKNLFNKYLDSNKYELIISYPGVDLYDIDKYDSIVLGGGSILLDGYISILHDAMLKNKNIFVWGSGYDWANKEFINLLEDTNEPPYLYSYSTEEKLQDIISYSKFFGVRGPLTYKLLEKTVVDTSNVLISGDPGFLLDYKDINKDNPILQLPSTDKIVAVNWGTCLNRIYGENEPFVEDTLASVCDFLIKDGYKIYLYAVWHEDLSPCESLYNKIINKKSVIFDKTLHDGGQLLSILKMCSFSINLKLHANIISAVSLTPFICLGYRFKCVDFVKSINCGDLIVFTDSYSLQKDLISKTMYITDNYNLIIDKINNRINTYNSLLEIPFVNNLFS